MSKTLFSSEGDRLVLGKEIGRGGEGSVFAVEGDQARVAKIYHKLPEQALQDKLRYMVTAHVGNLASYVTWPQQTIHESAGGPVRGFIMPKVSHRAPIHVVYSPAHRKREEPARKWDFLLLAARNTAAAFDAVHDRGHVIGDVNQNGVLIGSDARAVLIDSDSFQIRSDDRLFRCRVGVPEFTPPELQGIESFGSVDRTANHDNFGLAVLIFQLLLGGRHPFAGIPLRGDAGENMSLDIRSFRYADALDNGRRGLVRPSRSIDVSLMPRQFNDMMHQAFTETGPTSGRPTAAQWVRVLGGVLESVQRCGKNATHTFPGPVGTCPWCELEQEGLSYFTGAVTVRSNVDAFKDFDFDEAWSRIQGVVPPRIPPVPTPAASTCAPRPLPRGVVSKEWLYGLRAGAIIVPFVLILLLSSLWYVVVAGALVGWSLLSWLSRPFTAEREGRRLEHKVALESYDRLKLQYERNGLRCKHYAERLEDLRVEYRRLSEAQRKELASLEKRARQRLLDRYLQSCFIDGAAIAGVGQSRKAALRSFGIETAFDVTPGRVRQVRGFGDALTANVLGWRAACEKRFVFNPSHPSLVADRSAVKAKYAARVAQIQRQLSEGHRRLESEARLSQDQSNQLLPGLIRAAQQLAQAEADLLRV